MCSIPDLVHSRADMPFENFWFIDALVSTRKMTIILGCVYCVCAGSLLATDANQSLSMQGLWRDG